MPEKCCDCDLEEGPQPGHGGDELRVAVQPGVSVRQRQQDILHEDQAQLCHDRDGRPRRAPETHLQPPVHSYVREQAAVGHQ